MSENIQGQNITLHPAPLQGLPSEPNVKMSLCVTSPAVQRIIFFFYSLIAFFFLLHVFNNFIQTKKVSFFWKEENHP